VLPDDQSLITECLGGNPAAYGTLVSRYQDRLYNTVYRLVDNPDDASDVVQEAFAEAFQKLPEYLRTQPLSFYPWLRTIAWQRLVKLRRMHIGASRRSVRREETPSLPLAEGSTLILADQFLAKGTDPGRRMVREELRARVQKALIQLTSEDRELPGSGACSCVHLAGGGRADGHGRGSHGGSGRFIG
jgi:RNA polymerase sigma-70 factor (ECF subfamily)